MIIVQPLIITTITHVFLPLEYHSFHDHYASPDTVQLLLSPNLTISSLLCIYRV